MINKQYLKLLRSQQRFIENNFIYKIIAKRIIDSLDLLNIDVSAVLEVGINESKISKYIYNKFNNVSIDRADLCSSKSTINDKSNFLEINPDNLNFKKNFYNIIFSNFFIHLTSDFEKSLSNVMDGLKSNGLFIASLPDRECMYQLFNSMYETDLHFYKGAYQRVNPTKDVNDILSILKKLSYDSPSIYTDTISIEYQSFKKLLNDIKEMNISYCYKDKRETFENKKYFKTLENFYREKYFKENYILDIKVNIISAWKK